MPLPHVPDLLPTIASVRTKIEGDGRKYVVMRDVNWHIHVFTADEARVLAHELLAAADAIAPPRPRGRKRP